MARSISWRPLCGTALVASAIVAWRHGHQAAGPMQAAAILFACGAGFALDDPAANILASSPTALMRRRCLRLLLVLPPVSLLWCVLLAWQGAEGSEERWALTLVFAGLMTLSLAVAGVAGRTSWARGRGSLAAAPAVLFLVLLSSAVPRELRPLPLGDVPGGWVQIHLRWAVAAGVGAVVLLVSSRDPAGRSFPRAW